MRRMILWALGVVGASCLVAPGAQARVPAPRPVSGGAKITFLKADFEAFLERGRLRLKLPYRCAAACGGSLRVTLKTISGKRLGKSTVALRRYRKGRGVARMSVSLKVRWRQAELAVAHFELTEGGHRRRWARGMSFLLDGPKLVILGQERFVTGTPAAVRILVLHRRSGRPFKGVGVTATLSGPLTRVQRIRGTTGARGTLRAVFEVPTSLVGRKATLTLQARHRTGRRRLVHRISVSSKAKVLLVTDKPIYQPGQIIHLRSLALRVPSGGAVARRPVTFEVLDGKHNVVFRQTRRTDEFGIAHARFGLADQVNQGTYTVRARLLVDGRRSISSKKTVKVYTYRLPGFRIRTRLDKPQFRPGEAVTGEVYVWYVFGKPVIGGAISIEATLRHGVTRRVVLQRGTTNKWGAMRFRFQVPRGFGGKRGAGSATLRIRVKEPGGEVRSGGTEALIRRHAIVITLVPESGDLVPGMKQRLYVTTSLPSGAPVSARVVLKRAQASGGKLGVVQTDSRGLGVLTWKPPGALRIQATALDARGRTGSQVTRLAAAGGRATLLVRPERSLYREGQTMRVSINAGGRAVGGARVAYLDVIRAGQTLSTHAVTLRRGRGRLRVPLGNNTSGLLLLAAYVIPKRGEPIRDNRLVYVQQSGDLRVTVTADKPVYRPGERATLRFQVTNAAGRPVRAALGVRIVDAAVAELARVQPGRYRVFFRLERDLLMGVGSVPGFDDEQLVFGPTRGAGFRWRERAAAVLLAAASPAFNHSLRKSSDPAYLARMGRRAARAARPVLRKMAWRIARAARRELRRTWTQCGPEHITLERLLDRKLLRPAHVTDPWGLQIDLALFEGKGHWFTLEVHSWGLDQEQTTLDDITVKIRLRVRPPRGPKKGCHGLGFGGGGRGGGGGGGGGVGFGGWSGFSYSGLPEARRHFPEALYVNPALITDARGRATIRLKMADSITTWNLSALASTVDGRFGSVLGRIRVFTPFFVDVKPPRSWLLGDRITVPVAVHNHRRRADRIRVTLRPAAWYRLVAGPRTRTVAVGPNRVVSVPFVIEARQVGRWPLSVSARGTGVADAMTRRVVVRPGGDRVARSHAGYLERPLVYRVRLPQQTIAGSAELAVQVAPGAMAATVQGLDSLLREPHGCFEQTSSTTYPNVMILRHLGRKRGAHKLRRRARKLVAAGYQKLVTYEVTRGGFSLYGRAPADTALTGYGLHEFLDMAAVHPVDPKLIHRTREYLVGVQHKDGSWDASPSYFFCGAPKASDRHRVTAYVAWALARAKPTHKTKRHEAALARAETYLTRVLPKIKSVYTLALVGQFLAVRRSRSKHLRRLTGRLVALRVDQGRQTFWRPGAGRTLTGSGGMAATVETTALVTSLLLRQRLQLALARRSLRFLAAARTAAGGWGSTQATILSLRALLAATRISGGSDARGTLSVLLDGKVLPPLRITAQNTDVVQRVDLSAHLQVGAAHQLHLVFRGRGSPMVQVHSAYHVPYGKARRRASARSRLRLAVRYKRAPAGRRKQVDVRVTLHNPSPRAASLPLLDLGLPAGFRVGRRALESLVKRRVISRFEVRPGHLYLYVDKLASKGRLRLRYRLRAAQPLRVTAPPSSVYEYYDAGRRTFTPHATLAVGRLARR